MKMIVDGYFMFAFTPFLFYNPVVDGYEEEVFRVRMPRDP